MTSAEAEAWEARPWTADAVALRRWDDEAKVPGRVVSGLERWEPRLRDLMEASGS
jgi:gamma-butyrobetaine dioxygenase